ncbi:MAG: LacI family transcriptional regulator [Oscillospiraceae bacterium]|nr:LacI family transcriptional regulator [Oscillospiraceae bacterium]
MTTIREVADIAGVSKSTVSRVLNNSGYVSPEARKKVEQVVRETGYSPSAAAVSLSKRETNTIGVVIPEIDNNFFGEVLRGVSEICDQLDLSLICCDTGNNILKEDRALRSLGQQRVRGLIFTPATERDDTEERERLETYLGNLDVPIVLLDRHLDQSRWGGVYYENTESGYLATRELIRAGNQTVGIITGDLKLRIARERFQGFLQAMTEAGLPVEERYVLKGDFSTETAYALTREMFLSGQWPEGMVTCNNRTNLGFLKAVREMKKRIGRDIAVVGIDHVDVLDILDYNFSCVTRDSYEMGRVAMRLLNELVENKRFGQTVQTIPCVLSLKGSERRTLEDA